MGKEIDLSTVEGRKEACETIVRALEGRDEALAQHVKLLAVILAAELGDMVSSLL